MLWWRRFAVFRGGARKPRGTPRQHKAAGSDDVFFFEPIAALKGGVRAAAASAIGPARIDRTPSATAAVHSASTIAASASTSG